MKFADFDVGLKIRSASRRRAAPDVTVIMPTFARANSLLRESIESVLVQSFGDFEFIIVDDGSRDGTADVLESYRKLDPRVIVHEYRWNSGLPALRVDQAALHARGRYVAYQFDDDTWTSDSLKVRLERLSSIQGPGVVYGDCRLVSGHGTDQRAESLLGGAFNFGRLMNGNYIANNAVAHHRELFDLVGMYDPHVLFRRYSDYDLWLRAARVAPFEWLDAVVSEARVGLVNSLGRDVPLQFTQYRKSLGASRNESLLPSRIRQREILYVDPDGRPFHEDDVKEYFRAAALPFLARHTDHGSQAEHDVARAAGLPSLSLLVLKPDYSTSIDVTLGNFVEVCEGRGLNMTFVKESDAPSVDIAQFDVVVLYRTVGEHAVRLAELPPSARRPIVYLMDDNMLSVHEVDPTASALAPSSRAHSNILRQIAVADTVIGYSDPIMEDLRALNSRAIRLDTNIPARFVADVPQERNGPLRIGILSGPVRTGILRSLWPALEKFARHHPDAEIELWGIDPSQFGPLACPTKYVPFDHSYQRYREALLATRFDVVLVPLEGDFRALQSKSPVKLLEALAAKAICIFSDVLPYSNLPATCCLKAANTVEAWSAALARVLDMTPAAREQMHEAARKLALSKYATEVQFVDVIAAFSAVKLHATLRARSIAYGFHEIALGGATLHLIRHASLARSLGFDVIAIAPMDAAYERSFRDRWNEATGDAPLIFATWPGGYEGGPRQRPRSKLDKSAAADLAQLLRDHDVGLLHYATWSPTMMELAKTLQVPSVASVHQYYEGASSERIADSVHCSSLAHGARWQRTTKARVRRIVCPVDAAFFDLFGGKRPRMAAGKSLRVLISGTLQPRKAQLEALKAIALLAPGQDITVDIVGYEEFAPDYVEECRRFVAAAGIADRVRFKGFTLNPSAFYAEADLLLVAAKDESMPQTILQAMAAGVAVVATNVGGIGEIVRHRYSGFLADNDSPEALAGAIANYLSLTSAQRHELLDRAHRTAAFLARPGYVRAELIALYNDAVAHHRPERHAAAAGQHTNDPGRGMERTQARRIVAQLFSQVEKYDSSRGVRFARMLRLGRKTGWEDLQPTFAPLADFTRAHLIGSAIRGDLVLSPDLNDVPYREYVVRMPVMKLRSVSLALRPLLTPQTGTVGVEVVSQRHGILAQSLRSLTEVVDHVPTRFDFHVPVCDLDAGWLLRIFVTDTDVPVATFEVANSRAIWGRNKRMPFAEFT